MKDHIEVERMDHIEVELKDHIEVALFADVPTQIVISLAQLKIEGFLAVIVLTLQIAQFFQDNLQRQNWFMLI